MTKASGGHKWLSLAAIIPSVAMVYVDQSVLPVALPTIQQHLGATHAELWWCVNSYLLVSAVLMIVGGKIGDWVGCRKTFMWGTSIFMIASILCGLSTDIWWFIIARGLQGVGAAFMVPSSSPLIMSIFPEHERGRAIGVNVSVGSLFLVVAPFIGGYLTQMLSWRWIFWINVPLALVGLIAIPLLLPNIKGKKLSLDSLGFVFFTVAASCLVMLVMQGREWGWTSQMSLLTMAAGLVGTFFLVRRQKKVEEPFLDMTLFRSSIYKAVNISIFTTQFVLMMSVYRAVFFQEVLGWSPLKSGTIFFVTSLPVLFVSPIGGWIADRLGAKVPVVIGFILLIGSFIWTALFVEGSTGFIVAGLLVLGIGVPLILTPSYSSAMGAIPKHKAGTGFGIISTIRALAATLGVGITAAFARQAQWISFERLLNKNPATRDLEPSLMDDLFRGVQMPLDTLPPEQHSLVLEYLKESQIRGFIALHIFFVLILGVGFFFVLRLYHRHAKHSMHKVPGEGWD